MALAKNFVWDLFGVVVTSQSPANVSHILCLISKAVELSKPDESKIANSFDDNFSITDVSIENGLPVDWLIGESRKEKFGCNQFHLISFITNRSQAFV